MTTAAILDVDGTLVDTNYQHALAWYRAFREHGIVLPVWRIHRQLGMGGDQLVQALTGDAVASSQGDALSSRQGSIYGEMIDEVAPLEGATELLVSLRDAGHRVILSSSAREHEIEHYVDLLDARELADWTSSSDVEATKPAPDLVVAALDLAGASPREATMIGDSPWDVRAAEQAGVPTIAVMSGGFSREELLEAGAVAVFESVAELAETVRRSGLPRA